MAQDQKKIDELEEFLKQHDTADKGLRQILEALGFESMRSIGERYASGAELANDVKEAGIKIPLKVNGLIGKLFETLHANQSKGMCFYCHMVALFLFSSCDFALFSFLSSLNNNVLFVCLFVI